MTGLLVSVRDLHEAREAIAGGADVIDIKEPNRGALGAADAGVWHQVRGVVPQDVPLSVALGELVDRDMTDRAQLVPQIEFAKVGLAGCLELPNWRQRWADVLEQLPPATGRVAVGYADHRSAGAPDPRDVLQVATQLKCGTLLLDTYGKQQGDLFAFLDQDELRYLATMCERNEVALALAGSLTLATLPRALTLAPTLVAVRGAACQGSRTATVCSSLVKQLKQRITTNFDANLISS